MNETLNGKYPATLVGAVETLAPEERQNAVIFTWDVDGHDLRVTSKLVMKDSAGGRANAIINGTRAWLPAWDGNDLEWFAANTVRIRGTKATLQFEDGELLWVFPAEQRSALTKSATPDGIVVSLVVKPENVAKAPCEVTPDFAHTKAFFDIFTEGTKREDANYFWTQLAAKVGPMQIDFTSSDWQKMIELIRMLKSTTVILPRRTKG